MAKKKVHRAYTPNKSPRPTASTTRTGDRRGRAEQAAAAPVVASGWRGGLERRSKPALARMSLLPTFLVPALLAVLLFVGLVVPAAWAGGFLLAVGLFLTWLTTLSWPALSGRARLLRAAVAAIVLSLGVLKVFGVI